MILLLGENNMTDRFIMIKSKKYGVQIGIIDNEDYDKIKLFKLRLTKRSNSFYINCRLNGTGPSVTLHSIIMGTTFIDHINGNGLDNRKCNLRVCDYSGNNKNARKRKDYKHSKYKGVGKHINGKWIARIQVDGKRSTIGYFESELEAAIAYDRKAKELHGEFAKVNFDEQ